MPCLCSNHRCHSSQLEWSTVSSLHQSQYPVAKDGNHNNAKISASVFVISNRSRGQTTHLGSETAYSKAMLHLPHMFSMYQSNV